MHEEPYLQKDALLKMQWLIDVSLKWHCLTKGFSKSLRSCRDLQQRIVSYGSENVFCSKFHDAIYVATKSYHIKCITRRWTWFWLLYSYFCNAFPGQFTAPSSCFHYLSSSFIDLPVCRSVWGSHYICNQSQIRLSFIFCFTSQRALDVYNLFEHWTAISIFSFSLNGYSL